MASITCFASARSLNSEQGDNHAFAASQPRLLVFESQQQRPRQHYRGAETRDKHELKKRRGNTKLADIDGAFTPDSDATSNICSLRFHYVIPFAINSGATVSYGQVPTAKAPTIESARSSTASSFAS